MLGRRARSNHSSVRPFDAHIIRERLGASTISAVTFAHGKTVTRPGLGCARPLTAATSSGTLASVEVEPLHLLLRDADGADPALADGIAEASASTAPPPTSAPRPAETPFMAAPG